MSLLNLRKKKTTEEVAPPKKLVPTLVADKPISGSHSASGTSVNFGVLLRPHISERASDEALKGVYVFKVATKATKPQIASAVSARYKVTVEQVRIVTVHPKTITVKGKQGTRKGSKKAYVYLKKGEKIEII